MINRIIIFTFFPCMILALFLSMAGVQQVQFGDSYYSFLKSVSVSFESWKLTIPDIPRINQIATGDYDKSGIILVVLIKIANFFVGVVNTFIVIINVIINVLNVVIQLLQFIFTFIYRCKDFIDRLRPAMS